MKETNGRRDAFLGTFYESGAVFRIVKGTQIAAWAILGLYLLDAAVNSSIFLLQIARGFMVGLGMTDYLSQAVFYLKMPLPGLLYFIALQALAQGLLILVDIESNTRAASRPGGEGQG